MVSSSMPDVRVPSTQRLYFARKTHAGRTRGTHARYTHARRETPHLPFFMGSLLTGAMAMSEGSAFSIWQHL